MSEVGRGIMERSALFREDTVEILPGRSNLGCGWVTAFVTLGLSGSGNLALENGGTNRGGGPWRGGEELDRRMERGRPGCC